MQLWPDPRDGIDPADAASGLDPDVETGVDLHLREPSVLYEDRDFATGKTIWEDKSGGRHSFLERWVRDGRTWYTRSSGFVTSSVE
jgi:hypothetical protein